MRLAMLDIKLTAVAAAVTTIGWREQLNAIALPLVGVPALAVGAAFLGTLCSFAWGDPEPDRRRLWAVAVTGTFFGATGAALLPFLMGWENADNLRAPLAWALGFWARHLIPPAIQRGKELIQKFSPTSWFSKK